MSDAWDNFAKAVETGDVDIMDVLQEIARGSRTLQEIFPVWLQHVTSLARTVDYDIAVSVAQQGKVGEDVTHWIVGDLAVAMLAGADHGTKMDVLNGFAGDAGYSQAEMREMHGTAKFWPPHVRKALLDENPARPPSWSHFNRARRGLELEEAESSMMSAAQYGWSVAQLETHIQQLRGKHTPEIKKRNKIKMAIQSLGMLAGIGLPESIVHEARVLRLKLEDEL